MSFFRLIDKIKDLVVRETNKDSSSNHDLRYIFMKITKDNMQLTKEVRRLLCSDPEYAYKLALNIDKHSSDDTRQAACKDPYYAYVYAKNVDKQPRNDTRQAACKLPDLAYWYALDVDECPRDDTRKVASKDPDYAYKYAKDVDRGYHPITFESVRQNKYYLFLYVRNVDSTHLSILKQTIMQENDKAYMFLYALFFEDDVDKMREEILSDPLLSFLFAFYVDKKKPRPDTFRAVLKHPFYAYMYDLYINKKPTTEVWELLNSLINETIIGYVRPSTIANGHEIVDPLLRFSHLDENETITIRELKEKYMQDFIFQEKCSKMQEYIENLNTYSKALL